MINNSIFIAKNDAPYTDDQLQSVLLNPDARVAENKKSADLSFPADFAKQAAKTVPVAKAKSSVEMVQQLEAQMQVKDSKVGVDVEEIGNINIDNDTFLQRNFRPYGWVHEVDIHTFLACVVVLNAVLVP